MNNYRRSRTLPVTELLLAARRVGEGDAHQSVGSDASSAGDAEPHLHLPPLEGDLVLVPDHALLALERRRDSHVVRAGDGVWGRRVQQR